MPGHFSSAQYQSASRRRNLDVGFLRPYFDSSHLASEFLFEEISWFIISKANPLAKRKSLRVKDLAEEPLLLFDR